MQASGGARFLGASLVCTFQLVRLGRGGKTIGLAVFVLPLAGLSARWILSGHTPTPGSPPCTRSLHELCDRRGCPPYSKALTETSARLSRPFVCHTGNCGHGWYIRVENVGLSGSTEYFADDGQPVGVREWADSNTFCDGTAFGVIYGTVPSCSEESGTACPDAYDGGPSPIDACQATCNGDLTCLMKCSQHE